jgi:TRAP-type C4-dicarboxylate transport system substrate-binding protein
LWRVAIGRSLAAGARRVSEFAARPVANVRELRQNEAKRRPRLRLPARTTSEEETMTPTSTFRRAAPCLAAAAGLALVAASAHATQTINLTAVDGYPPKSLWVKTFIEVYIPEINKNLAKTKNFQIKWNQAWAGQITKVRFVLDGIQKGLGDIGVVTSVFHSDKVPLMGIAYATPFVTSDPALVARTFDDMAREYTVMADVWKKYNQIYLTTLTVLDSYQMFFRQKVTSIDDFNGRKVAAAGLNLRYLDKTGAVGVAGSMVNYYNDIKTGVVDGTMLWPEAIITMKINEVAPYMVKADIGTANSKAITINQDTYKKLPAEVRKAIHDASPVYRDVTAQEVLKESETAYDEYKKKGGTITQLTDAERKKWAMSMPNVSKEWVADLEKKGIPARQMLTAYMDRMRAAKQPILRHWDKE